jgi:beta-lactamase regulating signal transducer with metallopeptidase domain
MPVYFVYMLKASVCLAVIYLFYVLFLKNITYYAWNRYFLLTYCILASIIPLMNVNVAINDTQVNNITFFDRLTSFQGNAVPKNNTSGFSGLSISNLLAGVFTIGVVFMMIRLFIQLFSLWKMHLKATLLQDGKVKIYHLNERIIPFSYFNNIYLNKDNYRDTELTEIVKHEMVHVQQKHAIDILIIEIICIINWYNPIAWLLKKAIKENLEFIADGVVIKKGSNKKSYQYLLLKVTGNVSFSIANNLNFSPLKNRISMMNKSKTNPFHLLKFALLVPVATMLLLALRNKQEVVARKPLETSITKTYILSSLTYAIPDKKVKAVVKMEQAKCLLKTGQAMNLDIDLFLREQDRLRELLQKSGYNLEKTGYENTGRYGIIFMIDTTLGNNNFSVHVNINLAKKQLTQSKDQQSNDKEIGIPVTKPERLTNSGKQVAQNIQASSNTNEDELASVDRLQGSNLFAIK